MRHPESRPLLFDVVRSEWTKLWSVQSTYWALGLSAAALIALAAVFPATAAATRSDPAAFGLSGFFQAQLAVAVLGVLAVTSEYTSGSMRATLTATPQRITVLVAKAVVVAVPTAMVGTASAFIAFFVAKQVFSGNGITVALSDQGAVRTVIGTGLYLCVVAVFAVAVGAIVRSSVAATAVIVALMLLLPGLATVFPPTWADTIVPYLPPAAGQAIIGETRFAPSGTHLLAPWSGFAVFCAYVAATFVAAGVILTRRDSG